jgi:3-phosphoshikimate 1-carboxyvinyltransferase
MMKHFGVEAIQEDDLRFGVKSGQRYIPSMIEVESDWSSAAYFLAGAAITKGVITVDRLQTNSIQGDSRIVEILERMGVQKGELKGIDVDLQSTPDLVPTVAVLGLFAIGKTLIRNVAHLRVKESNRLEALACELRKLGASVTLLEDGLEIEPTNLHGARLQTYDDHRLAMSFALIGLCVPGVIIENPDCVKKSFPQFWAEFEKIEKAC